MCLLLPLAAGFMVSCRRMKPAPFKYIAASSLDEALARKAAYGDEARFLAGGQSLVPMLNFRVAQPAALIDINAIPDLSGVSQADGRLRIGALTRYRDLEADDVIRTQVPLIGEALPHVAHPQIRNRGTLGGNLAHADPASEMLAIVVALNARLRARSAQGERWIQARDFFIAPLTTALEPDEMLVEIELPRRQQRSGHCFMEVARRRGDFALIGVATTVELDQAGRCSELRLACCGAGETPVDLSEAVSSLTGETPSDAAIADAAASLQRQIDPPGNLHAGKEFQRHLAGILARRTLTVAVERACHG